MPIPKDLPKFKGAESSVDISCTEVSQATANVLSKKYALGNKLGSGNFGSVFIVNDISNGERKVLKRIKVGEIQPNETIEAVKEATLLAKLDHPAIVRFHDSFMDGDCFCIITEYCEGGDLDHFLRQLKENGRTLGESLILDWFVQLTNAVSYIHDRKVLHRDLKTRNIFLKDNKIKLGDFGISRILIGTSDYATTFTGTPYYMSPEVLKHDGYNAKSDIWSLGAVLYELCTCEHAFYGNSLIAVMYKIVEGHPPKLPDHFSSSLQYLYDRMMDKIPDRRPTAVDILQDHYIQQHMKSLSHKLALFISKSNPLEEAKEIAMALKKKNDITNPLTPRQEMLHRKMNKADKEGEKLKQEASKNFIENQKRLKEQKKKKKTKIVPPWVEEHPDVFNDSSFSITAAEITRENDVLSESLMELSVIDDKPANQQLSNDLLTPEDNVYNEYEDDFEMDISSNCETEENDYEAILHSINEALKLPKQKISDEEELPLFAPLARESRIAKLKCDAEGLLGKEIYQSVYEYLKYARSDYGIENEEQVIAGLKQITDNIRDCFVVDQIVFLEKQIVHI